MGEKMYKYELTAPFQNKNAGFSRWTFGKVKGREYFLKEFMDPVYPDESSLSEKLRQERIQMCEEYEKKKKKLYKAIERASDGNLLRIHEFFRCDSHYYIAMEKIEDQGIRADDLMKFSFEKRFLLCKTIAHAVMNLHKEHIVHADIKANNILIRRTLTSSLVGKIIDFDASFFESDPPEAEDELVADQIYMAPEACKFICGEEAELTCKIDVFSLGILFHQYLTGSLPEYDHEEYDYLFEAVLDGQKPGISSKLSPYYRSLIEGMLRCEPEDRFSMEKVYAVLRNLDPNETPEEENVPNTGEEGKGEETGRKDKKHEEKKADEFGFMEAGDL